MKRENISMLCGLIRVIAVNPRGNMVPRQKD